MTTNAMAGCHTPPLPSQHTTNQEEMTMEDLRERCGESGCICYGIGEEHADCACGCDCPRCDECRQAPECCDCDD